MAVPWHQDGVYWGESLDPMHVITMWLAVDESKVENGCMRVIAGSHNLRDRRYENVDRKNNLFGSEVVDADLRHIQGGQFGIRGRRMSFSRRVDDPQFESECFRETTVRLHNALYASKRPLPGRRMATRTSYLSVARRRQNRRF